MNAHDYAQQILGRDRVVRQVYWVACGGSVIDLYPAHSLLAAKSPSIESAIYTGAEFDLMPPAALGKDSVVIACTHSGGTAETLKAASIAKERGAYVLGMTNNAGSRVDDGEWPCWVYEWEDETPQEARPAGFSLALAAELMARQDGYAELDVLTRGITQLDAVIPDAMSRVSAEMGPTFANLCKEHDFLYILGSGPTFCQTYGFAICSLMEMQWQNCSYINSAEYFHGPFECTEDGVFYFLQKSSGTNRPIDERAERFLKAHTDTLMVLDSAEFGMMNVDERVRTYLDPIFFYEMNVALRVARGKVFDHDPDYRRYMGVVEY